MPLRLGSGNGLVNIRLNEAPPGGNALFLSGNLPVMAGSALLGMLDHGQPMLPAEPVRDLLEVVQALGIGMEPLAVRKGYGVDCKVVVQVIPVQVGGNDHLEPVSPEFTRKLHSDLVGLFRRHLSGCEGLVGVESHGAVGLAKVPLDGVHLQPGHIRGTVDAGDKLPLIGLISPPHIVQHRFQGIRLAGGFCFVLVLDIAQDVAYVALNGPDFCGCHLISPCCKFCA